MIIEIAIFQQIEQNQYRISWSECDSIVTPH